MDWINVVIFVWLMWLTGKVANLEKMLPFIQKKLEEMLSILDRTER